MAVLAAVVVVVIVAVGPASASEATLTQTVAAVAEPLPVTPTTVAAPRLEVAAPAGPQVEYSAEELEFVQLLNEYRESKGLEPLLLSDTLTVACDRHTADMVNYDFVNHYTGYYRASGGQDVALEGTRSDYFNTGTDPAERMVACGYDYRTVMGENLALGQPNAADALQALKDSPTHNANLLSSDYKVIGIALIHDGGSQWGHYWTTDFGGYVDSTAHALATLVAQAD